ncbi:MAG: hypothetical protein U0401_00145 [Anaerolineae bacterium]
MVLPRYNQFVGVFKGAAIVSLIGVADLMYFAREASLKFFRPFLEFYSVQICSLSVPLFLARW